MTYTSPGRWFHDPINKDLVNLHSLNKILYTGYSDFQSIEIVETGSFGLSLVLDGKIQSSQKDEFIYHESLVHPAMITHPNPKRVFIAGGGEGATLREVLRYHSTVEATMVDIDRKAVEICEKYLKLFHCGAFSDKRTKLYHTDARKYLKNSRTKYDVVIIDVTDPMEGGPSYLLFTQEFYEIVKSHLGENGILVAQAGPTTLTQWHSFSCVVNTLRRVFPVVRPYQAVVPAFVDQWGFALASTTSDPLRLIPSQINRRLKNRIKGDLGYYDGITHQHMFMLPKHLRKKLAATRRIISDGKPVFAYQV